MNDRDFDQLTNDVRLIKDALLGGGLHKNTGLIDEQCKLKKRVDAHDKIFWMMNGAYVLVILLIGALSYIIK
jgi:hypothetical protein